MQGKKFFRGAAFFAVSAWSSLALADTYTCVSYSSSPSDAASGLAAGFEAHVVNTVFRNAGHAVIIKTYPYQRAVEMARSGGADCIFPIAKSPSLGSGFEYSSISIAPQVIYFYARKGMRAIFNGDMDSLRHYRIGVVAKAYYGARFETMRNQFTLEKTQSLDSALAKLAAGRVDLVPSDSHTASRALSSPSLRGHADKIVRLPVPIESVPTFVAFSTSIKRLGVVDAFNAALADYMETGRYAELAVRKHFYDLPPVSTDFAGNF